MAQGVEHVESALKLIESASDEIGKLGSVDENWKRDAMTRLTVIADRLRATRERFFLKTRLCLPFAGKCETTAQKLGALLAELSAHSAPDGEAQAVELNRMSVALDALEMAVKTLDERSLMQGMAIT